MDPQPFTLKPSLKILVGLLSFFFSFFLAALAWNESTLYDHRQSRIDPVLVIQAWVAEKKCQIVATNYFGAAMRPHALVVYLV
jgi:hypothetical protein